MKFKYLLLIGIICILSTLVSAKLSDSYISKTIDFSQVDFKGDIVSVEELMRDMPVVDSSELVLKEGDILQSDGQTVYQKDTDTGFVIKNNLEININNFESNTGEKVSLETYGSFDDICLIFPVKGITVRNITIEGKSIKDKEYKTNNNYCYTNISNSNASIEYVLDYKGAGKIKYNILMNETLLDPYVIGTLSTESLLGIYLPFDGNISNMWSSKANLVDSSSVRAVSGTYTYSSTGSALWTNPAYSDDNDWNTKDDKGCAIGAVCTHNQYFSFTKNSTDTGSFFDMKGRLYGSLNITVSDNCFNAYTTKVDMYVYAWNLASDNSGTSIYCDNGGGYDTLWSTGSSASFEDIYETRMRFTNTSNYTAYNYPEVKTQYHNVNGLIWSNSFKFWGNDTTNSLANEINTSKTLIQNGVTFNDSGAYFDGTNSYLVLPSTTNSVLSSGNITWDILFTPLGNPNDYVLFGKGNRSGDFFDYGISASIGINNYACILYNTSGNAISTTTITVTNNTPTRITCVYDSIGNQLKQYVNGILNDTDAVIGILANNGMNITIGAWNPTRGLSIGGFNGTISSFNLYNRTLSPEEVYNLHRGGNFSTNLLGEVNKSIYLNGWETILVSNTSNVFNVYPNISYTYSFWYNTPAFSEILGTANHGLTQFYSYNGYSGMAATALYTQYNTNKWSNHVTKYDGNTLSTYLNGVQKNSTSYNGGVGSNPAPLLVIGAQTTPVNAWVYNTQSYMKGYLDELMFYNKALTQTEINILSGGYNNSINFNVKDSKLLNDITSLIYISIYGTDNNYTKLLSTSSGAVFWNGIPEGTYRFTAYSLENNTYSTSVIYNTYITYNSAYNVTFYMSNQTGETTQQVLLIVRDASDQGLEDATISIYAENLNSGIPYLTQSPKTNINGQYLASLVRDSVYYSFIISYNNKICYQTTKSFIIQASDNTIYFRCITGLDYITNQNKYNNVNVSIASVNTSNLTGYFSVIASALYQGNICLNVYRNPSSENLNLYSNCQNTTAYLNTVYLNASNQTKDTTYYATVSYMASGDINSQIMNGGSLLFRIEPHIGWGNVGYFIFFLLIILVSTYFVKHPSLIGIALGGIWLIACRIGLFDFGANTMNVGYIGLFIGIVVGFAIETRNR